MSKLIKPDNGDILAFGHKADKLDTGMSAQEAIQRATNWWETKGRKMMQTELKRQAGAVGGSNNGAGSAFASSDVESANFLPSGIIHGKPWDELNRREKQQVVKVWHHFNIRKPDLLDEEQAEHKMQDRGLIQ